MIRGVVWLVEIYKKKKKKKKKQQHLNFKKKRKLICKCFTLPRSIMVNHRPLRDNPENI